MENYTVDESSKPVALEVKAGVVGIANTRVYLKKKYRKFLFGSEPFSGGSIPFTPIGNNQALPRSRVVVDTFMDLSNLSDEERKKAIATILIQYSLKGGPLGLQTFETLPIEIDETNPNLIIITKTITFG